VALGAAAAPHVHAGRVAATLVAFFLAVGVAAHALDELRGRPLRTCLSDRLMWGLAVAGLTGALALGALGAFTVSLGLLGFMVAGAIAVLAYNLELFGGAIHNSAGFALAWGGLPALTGYWINALALRPPGVVVALACVLLSLAQRRLSTPARELRRRTVALTGRQLFSSGDEVELSAVRLAEPLEGALGALAMALPLLAAGLVLARL
jgi:hypothetical protein